MIAMLGSPPAAVAQGAWLAAATVFIVATAVQPIVIGMLRRASVLDVPGDRSSHVVPTPRGGGVALVFGLVAGTWYLHSTAVWPCFIVAVLGLGVVGLVEDLHGIPVLGRLLLQGLAGAGAAELLVTSAGPFTPVITVLMIAAVAAWITGFANAFNFMDGINGISAAHTVVAGLAFVGIGQLRAEPVLLVTGAVLAAAGAAFLPWNAGRARVFLGDVGSYALGGCIAAVSAYAVIRGLQVEAAIAPLILYIGDTSVTLIRRVRAREPLLRPHRTHVYQRLCDLGWSHQRVTVVTASSALFISALGLVSASGSSTLRIAADILAVCVLVGYLTSPPRLTSRRIGGTRSVNVGARLIQHFK